MHSKMNTEMLQLVEELHKPARRDYKRRHVDICGINETGQADIVKMLLYEKQKMVGNIQRVSI